MSERLSDEVLADILAKASAACGAMPTPWRYSQDPCDDACGWVESANGGTPTGGYDGQWLKAPAEFVAAANPATISALVREVQRLREKVDNYESALETIAGMSAQMAESCAASDAQDALNESRDA